MVSVVSDMIEAISRAAQTLENKKDLVKSADSISLPFIESVLKEFSEKGRTVSKLENINSSVVELLKRGGDRGEVKSYGDDGDIEEIRKSFLAKVKRILNRNN